MAERLLVAGVVAQRARVGVERGVRVADHLLVQPADPVQELDPGQRIVVVRDHHLEDVDELGELAGGLVDRLEHAGRHHRLDLAVDQAVERVQRLGVLRIDLERLAVALDRAGDVAEPDLPQVADPVLERDGLAGGLGELDLALEVAEQVVPALGLAVQPVERLDRRQLVGVEVEDALVGLDRLGDVAELAVVDLREHVQHRASCRRDPRRGRPSSRRRP